jgi:hypothetical protein
MGFLNKIIIIGLTSVSVMGYMNHETYYYYTLAALIVYLVLFVFGIKRVGQLFMYMVFVFNLIGCFNVDGIFILIPTAVLYFLVYGKHNSKKVNITLILISLLISQSIALLLGGYFGYNALFGYMIFMHIPFKADSEIEEVVIKSFQLTVDDDY